MVRTREAERAVSRAPPADDLDDRRSADDQSDHRTIDRVARAAAAALLMLVAIAITLVSVVGRYGFSAPVPGDYELVETDLRASASSCSFPIRMRPAATSSSSSSRPECRARHQRMLDLVHDVIFAVVAALLAWRLGDRLCRQIRTPANRPCWSAIPFWWSYSFAVASMALLCVVCLARIVAGDRETLRQ